MSSVREERKERQERNEDPINFTCGECKKVVPFQQGYVCDNCGANKEVTE